MPDNEGPGLIVNSTVENAAWIAALHMHADGSCTTGSHADVSSQCLSGRSSCHQGAVVYEQEVPSGSLVLNTPCTTGYVNPLFA